MTKLNAGLSTHQKQLLDRAIEIAHYQFWCADAIEVREAVIKDWVDACRLCLYTDDYYWSLPRLVAVVCYYTVRYERGDL